MAELQSIIKLSQADFDTLANGGTITKDGKQYVYDSNALYCVQTDIPQPIIDVTTLPTTDIQTDSLYRVVGQATPPKLYHYKDNAWIEIQPTTDNTLTTTAKEIVPAINEVNAKKEVTTIVARCTDPANYDIPTNWSFYKPEDVIFENGTWTFNNPMNATQFITWFTAQAQYQRFCIEPPILRVIINNSVNDLCSGFFYRLTRYIVRSSTIDFLFSLPESDFVNNDLRVLGYNNGTWYFNKTAFDTSNLTTTDKTIVGAINELNADKAPYSSLKHVGSTSLSADLLWDISEPASTEMRVKIASDDIEPIGVRGYGTMIIMERRAGTGNESQVFLELYANRDATNTPLQTPFNKYVKMGILPAEHNGAFSTQFSNITWSKWMRVEQGEHNTLNASGATNVNNCIFQLVVVRGTRYFRDSKLYYASMTDPIGNTTIYGECLTEEMNQSNKLYITQTFKQYTTNNASQVVFKRQGYFTFSTEEGAWETPTVVWGAWFPIEYPQTSLTLNTGWDGNIVIDVTGGILTLHILNLTKTSSATSNLPINSSSAPGTGLIALPIKYVVWRTIYKTDDMSLVNTVWRQNEGLTVSNNIVQDAQYRSTIHIPLGY